MLARTTRFIGGAAFLLAAATVPAGAQVVNGGFETPSVGTGLAFFNEGQSFTGWQVVGAPGNVSIVGTDFGAPHGGTQWMDLTGTSNSLTGVEQKIATTSGAGYNLSFWVGNDNTYGSINSTSLVYIDGTLVKTATNSTQSGNTMFWQQFTVPFTATGSTTNVTFLNGDPSNDTLNGLDDVAVNQTSGVTTTPEPSSMALLGTGLVGLVPMIRRRRKA